MNTFELPRMVLGPVCVLIAINHYCESVSVVSGSLRPDELYSP